MALNVTQAELRASVRKFANVQGTTAALRHPDADINDYINRALGSLHRRLTSAVPDQRYLASATITTTAGASTEPLPSDFVHLISAELQASGYRYWLQAYEMHERPVLADENAPGASNGIPLAYRLRGDNIDFLPVPGDEYDILLWYVPSVPQLDADADTFDTISRLDDYIIAYAAKPVAVKDKNWDLVAECRATLAELAGEVDALARNRDRNSPPRVIDQYAADRWGRQRRLR